MLAVTEASGLRDFEEAARSGTTEDWMLWMVHRAWLDDPTLTSVSFSGLAMPPPDLEPRIAPKLVAAMARNTHVMSLQVAACGLVDSQALQLAEALRENRTLQVLNVEGNSLQVGSIRALVQAIGRNAKLRLKCFHFGGRVHLGLLFLRHWYAKPLPMEPCQSTASSQMPATPATDGDPAADAAHAGRPARASAFLAASAACASGSRDRGTKHTKRPASVPRLNLAAVSRTLSEDDAPQPHDMGCVEKRAASPPKVCATADPARSDRTISESASGSSSAPRAEFSYTLPSDVLVVRRQVSLAPSWTVARCAASSTANFSVEPPLPDGLSLDPSSGHVHGAPTGAASRATYRVSVAARDGRGVAVNSASTALVFACVDYGSLLAATTLNDMPAEPSKMGGQLSEWMAWTVHRAFLNDPALPVVNFNNLTMPLPHTDPHIAPKLMRAIATNTHITCLSLAHSNMQILQGIELAESLRRNTTIRILNVESNSLNSDAVLAIVEAIGHNTDSAIEELWFNNQKHVGSQFGRVVERSVGEMMLKNTRLLKLGFLCSDTRWRLIIDRALMRNNGYARQRRKTKTPRDVEAEIVAQRRSLNSIVVVSPPQEKTSSDTFCVRGDEAVHTCAGDPVVKQQAACMASLKAIVCDHVAQTRRLPTKELLQALARRSGQSLTYALAAQCVNEFRARLLDVAVGLQVQVTDANLAEFTGVLKAWSEKNHRWSFDVWPAADRRLNFASERQPAIEVSEEFAAWLRPEFDRSPDDG